MIKILLELLVLMKLGTLLLQLLIQMILLGSSFSLWKCSAPLSPAYLDRSGKEKTSPTTDRRLCSMISPVFHSPSSRHYGSSFQSGHSKVGILLFTSKVADLYVWGEPIENRCWLNACLFVMDYTPRTRHTWIGKTRFQVRLQLTPFCRPAPPL